MSAKSNTTSRDQVAAEIAAQLMASISSPKNTASITDRLLQWSANRVADAGNGVAEIAAGFGAAAQNYAVHREAARQRQAARTAAKVAALVEAELQARGI